MRFTKSVALATLAASTIVSTRGASVAATGPTVYAFSSPNHYVEYLLLNGVGDQVKGYFEIDQRSDDSTVAEKRTQIPISQKVVGNVVAFDKYSAVRSADTFTLTSVSEDGQVTEQRLSRVTTSWLNASLGTLAISARRSHALTDLQAAKAELRRLGAVEQTPTSLLARAQGRLDGAVMAARDLQMKADVLWHVANDLRAVADAQIDAPGVNRVQNELLKTAMENADQAERKARSAQRVAVLAVAEAATDEDDVVVARNRIAALKDRVATSAAILRSTGDLADR